MRMNQATDLNEGSKWKLFMMSHGLCKNVSWWRIVNSLYMLQTCKTSAFHIIIGGFNNRIANMSLCDYANELVITWTNSLKQTVRKNQTCYHYCLGKRNCDLIVIFISNQLIRIFHMRIILVLGYGSGTCWKQLDFLWYMNKKSLSFRKHTQLENKFRDFDAFQQRRFALMSNSTFQLSKARTTDLFKPVFFATWNSKCLETALKRPSSVCWQ